MVSLERYKTNRFWRLAVCVSFDNAPMTGKNEEVCYELGEISPGSPKNEKREC